jgi:hypothetical protein
MSNRWFVAVALVASLVAWARSSSAATRTCVAVHAAHDAEALRRFVDDELARHPSHEPVTTECESHLSVELLELGKERYVTARVEGEVPHREPVGTDGLGRAVERALTVVLHNDPRRLYGPDTAGWLERQVRAFRMHGTTAFGLELYESAALVHGSPQTLGGLALTARRETSMFYVGVHLGAASTLGEGGPRLHLGEQFVAAAEIGLFSSGSESTTAFVGVVGGLEVQRFSGPAPPSGKQDGAIASGFSVGLRGGVELMRIADVRYQAFARILVPTFRSQDPDGGLVSQWTPSVGIGVGVLF